MTPINISMKTNCLWFALDKWHEQGGRLIFAKSVHWCIPHVMHEDVNGELSHFVPHSNLNQPWHSVFGFEGIEMHVDQDQLTRLAMSKIGMFLGLHILYVLGGAWAIRHWLKKK